MGPRILVPSIDKDVKYGVLVWLKCTNYAMDNFVTTNFVQSFDMGVRACGEQAWSHIYGVNEGKMCNLGLGV